MNIKRNGLARTLTSLWFLLAFGLLLPATGLAAGECRMEHGTLHWALWIGSLIYRGALIVLVYLIYREVKTKK